MPDIRHHLFNPASFLFYPLRWLVILALGLIVYGQTFGFGFVFDDHLFIVTNQAIKDFHKLTEIWSGFPLTRMVGMYSFAANYALGQLHPSGYHIFNFCVHLVATALVWATAGVLFRIYPPSGLTPGSRREFPFVIALLFLVHPCQTQAVTYISQRFESLAALFYLAAIYSYLRARTETRGYRQILFVTLTVVSIVLGILSKETAFTIPVMILITEGMIIRSERFFLWLRWPRIGLILAAGIVFAGIWIKLGLSKINILWTPVVSESHDGDVISPWNYLLTQMRVLLTFVRLLIFPVNQNLDYDFPMSSGFFHPPLTFFGAGLMAAMITLAAKLRRRFPLIAFGLAWMLVTFSMNLVPRPNLIFEHKLYLISFGFLLAAITALVEWIRSEKTLVVVLPVIIVMLCVTSVGRNHIWRNEQLLWEDTIKKSPGKARVHANLSRIYSSLNRNDEALALMNKAVALKPGESVFYLNRGILYLSLAKPDEALKDFDKAVLLSPRNITYTARAQFYISRQNDQAAFDDLSQAIRMEPNFQDAYVIRGSLLMKKGRVAQAMEDFNRALTIAPYEYGALINRGAIYYSSGKFDAALADFTRAQELEASQLTHKNRALCLLALNRIQEARQELAASRLLNPDDAQVQALLEKINH
jgi:Tfp pilus assembly protein PilF